MDDDHDPMKDTRPRVTPEVVREMKARLQPLPDWLLPALGCAARNGENGAPRAHVEPGEVIPDGSRDDTLTRMAGAMRAKGFDESAILAALLATNETRCVPPLEAGQVEKIARSVSRYEPDPFAHVTIKGVKAAGGASATPEQTAEAVEIVRIPASLLVAAERHAEWVWKGYLARGGITLFSALWKAGKTTLLAHLLQALGGGGTFCGQDAAPAKVLYVTEESQALWAARRDKVKFGDWCEFVVRPFAQKPTLNGWYAFINSLADSLKQRPADLVIFDPITNLWPVKDENSAAEVTTALLPLRTLDPGECRNLTLVHHLRKSDGAEGVGSRGSGALTGFVDTIVELRRHTPGDAKDRRRVLTAHGRYDDTPAEAVVELTDHGYALHGTKSETAAEDAVKVLLDLLPGEPPGLTQDQIRESWPGGSPRKQTMTDALRHGTNVGFWRMDGSGHKGDPLRYWRITR
jgi:hypothetical protein